MQLVILVEDKYIIIGIDGEDTCRHIYDRLINDCDFDEYDFEQNRHTLIDDNENIVPFNNTRICKYFNTMDENRRIVLDLVYM